ncbi:MAG: dihydrolipoyl dehydrogenase [Actinomycetota bacterium]|nr:dihydrolipoyl dehydrogenase [Actinomycetota bacterium]
MAGRVEDADVVVIGAGGGGYPGAFVLDRAGRRVVMVDPIGNLGGDCLAEGCVPSKAVREASLVRARATRYAAFGLDGPAPGVSWPAVLAHKDRVQRTRYAQHTGELASSTIRLHTGTARVTSERVVEVSQPDGPTQRYRFADLVVATGSAPSRLPIPGAELTLSSHDLFRLGADLAFPERPVIIGGGYIGVEVASMLDNLGAAPTVLEATGELLPGFDPDLAAGVHAQLGRRVTILTDAFVSAVERSAGGYIVHYRRAGAEAQVSGDVVVMATGRHVVLPEGLEHLGLPAGEPPAVDRLLRTVNTHVYAPGDVNGRSMLFHSAVRQSLVAAHAILAGGQPVDAMNFEAVPMTVFTEPEAAHVGLTEAQAADRFGDVDVTRYDYREDARAQILDETEGFVKLVFDGRSGRLAGAQVLGVDAAQLIAPLALAVHAGLGAAALAEVAFPHPMISEGISKAARAEHA